MIVLSRTLYSVHNIYYKPGVWHMINVYCTLYIVQCTLYNVHNIYYIPCVWHMKMYIVRCTLYIIQCTEYIIYKLCMGESHDYFASAIRCKCNVHCTSCVLLLYTMQCTLYTVQCTVCTVHCTLYIVHCTVYVSTCC